MFAAKVRAGFTPHLRAEVWHHSGAHVGRRAHSRISRGWYSLQSSTGYSTYVSYLWGLAGDIPLLKRP